MLSLTIIQYIINELNKTDWFIIKTDWFIINILYINDVATFTSDNVDDCETNVATVSGHRSVAPDSQILL